MPLKVNGFSLLDKVDVIHLVLKLCNLLLSLVDASLRLPVHHHSHQVLAARLEHVVDGALDDSLPVLFSSVPLHPH